MRTSIRFIVAGLMSVLALGIAPVGAASAGALSVNMVHCCR